MRVIPVPVLRDNYAYLVVDEEGGAVVVDPAEPDKVLWAAHVQHARVSTALITHRHADHAGGNLKLLAQLPALEVVGGAGEGVPGATMEVADGQELQAGRLRIRCLHTPYHTTGHVCYLVSEEGCSDPAVLLSGDVLFIGGCGRNFAGTPEQMYSTLLEVLAALPTDTRLYCGHEYSVANLEFAVSIDGSNEALQRKLAWAKERRQQGLPTVPSTLQEELQYNPFLRCHDPTLQQRCGISTGTSGSSSGSGTDSSKEAAVATLAELRRLKDNWGTFGKIMTAVLRVGAWFGWRP